MLSATNNTPLAPKVMTPADCSSALPGIRLALTSCAIDVVANTTRRTSTLNTVRNLVINPPTGIGQLEQSSVASTIPSLRYRGQEKEHVSRGRETRGDH